MTKDEVIDAISESLDDLEFNMTISIDIGKNLFEFAFDENDNLSSIDIYAEGDIKIKEGPPCNRIEISV
jgi:hypothetical protein